MIRQLLLSLPLLSLVACGPKNSTRCACPEPTPEETLQQPTPADFLKQVRSSVVRVNATLQDWNPAQPWEKNPPTQRRALGAIVGEQQVITTAELAINATYIELESPDGTRFIPAKVIVRDDEANLALLGPANPDEGKTFFQDTQALTIAKPASIGEPLSILQLESNGLTLITPGTLQSVGLSAGLLPGNHFLTYMVKASMQSAESSYSLPVLNGNQLAGVLLSYDSNDQICSITSTDIIQRFLNEAAKERYTGFPSIGVKIATTEDPSFRQWLKLTDDQGGIYIQGVRKGAAADLAGIQQGDVILAIDGHSIDRRGYYNHPNYGKLLWPHLIRGEKTVGDPLTLSILRDGQSIDIVATLSREEEADKIVPNQLIDVAPNFLVKGGMIFQELTRNYLEAFGKEWTSRAPLNLLDAYENPEAYEGKARRVVFLSAVIPTPATIGYESLRSLIVTKVNDHDVVDIASLIQAFESPKNGLHSIEFKDEHLPIYLDERVSSIIDAELLKRGLSSLSHVESQTEPSNSQH